MIRTRVSAAFAAVALIGVAVFGGTIAAHAVVIAPPAIASAGGVTTDATPLIFGTVDNPDAVDLTVTVFVANSSGVSHYCFAPVAAASPATGASWGCSAESDLPYEVGQSFSAVVAENSTPLEYSSSSNAVQYSIGGTQNATLTAPGATTYDATPTFSGTGPSLGLINVNDGSTSYCIDTVDAAGNWSCTVSAALGAAVHPDIRADPTWITGAAAPGTAPQSLEVLAPPAPSVDPFDPATTSDERPSIQGTKDIDSSYVQGYWSTDGETWTAYCQVTTGVGGTEWSCDPPFSSIPLGTVHLAAIAFNEAGDASAMSAPITIERVPEPVIMSPVDGSYTSNPRPEISGTATGSSVNLWYGEEGALCRDVPIESGSFHCIPAEPLADGTYEYTVEAAPGVSSGPWSFTVDTVDPAGPIITGPSVPLATTTSSHPTISGTGEPGATVRVYIDGEARPCIGGAPTIDQFGAWTCQIAPTQPPGTYNYAVRQTDGAGNTSSGPLITQLTLTIATVPSPTASPSPSTTPPPAPSPAPSPSALLAPAFEVAVGGKEFAPGDTTLITGSGLPPGAAVRVEFHSTPVLLGSTVVDDGGSFSLLVRIPEDAEPGAHRIVVLVTPPDGSSATREQAVTVITPAASSESAGETDAEALAATAAATESGDIPRSEPAAPSGLTGTIHTLASIVSNPAAIGAAAVSGLVLLLFVAFPAELLNSTISEQYQRVFRRAPKLTALERFTNWLERVPWLGALAITLVGAFVFGFADPGFGPDVTSLRVVLACAIALFVVGYLASSIAGLIIRRRWRLTTSMELKPLGLLLTVVGVVVSRLLDFSPGFLIGLLLGIGLVGRTSAGDRAKATLVQAGVVFALSILGWVGYSILMSSGETTGFASALALDTMVAITTEGLTALFIGLLPFRLLDGSAIFAHSKAAWAAAYTVAAAAFVLIVVPSAWGEFDGSLWLWVALVGGFTLIAVATYLYFRFRADREDDDEAQDPELAEARR